MNIKKKAIFGMVAGFFAVATIFNMSMLNDNSAGDVSMDAIAVMAQADDSESGGSCPGGSWQIVFNTGTWSECDGYDYVTYTNGGSFEICTTTGAIKNDNTYYREISRVHDDPSCEPESC